jgi:hypothetical protein
MLFSKRVVTAFCLLILSHFSIAQTRDRIYLHSDRSVYIAGETIWFKAYLLSGLVPGSKGTNLVVDIVNEEGERMESGSLPIFGGIALGSMDLSLRMAEGIYFLRAYTLTQGAKDQYSSVIKTIYVYNPAVPVAVKSSIEASCQFRPSSGNLVVGLNNAVNVSARDSMGKGAVVEGTLLNSKNENIISFKTNEEGLARFVFTPVNDETYTARVRFADGKVKSFALPKPETNKILVGTGDAAGFKIFNVLIPPVLRTGAAMSIKGYMDDNVVFEKNFTASVERFAARIPVDDLPSGLMQLTVTDQQNQKLGQAVTWILSDSSLLPVIFKADTLNLSPGGRNVFSFTVPEAIIGSFSVSITDRDKTTVTKENNIITGLLLNQESKSHAFVAPSMEGNADVALALGASDWQDQYANSRLKLLYVDSNYLTIRGRLLTKEKKPITKGDLSFMSVNKDSISSIFSATLAKDGSFSLPKMIFAGNQDFKYSLNGNRWTDIEMDLDTRRPENMLKLPFDRSVLIADMTVLADTTTAKQDKETYTYLLADSISSTGLKSVTVTARKPSPKQQVNDAYAKGLFNDMHRGKILDLINEPPLGNAGNILDYLAGGLIGGGLSIVSLGGGNYSIGSTRMLSFRNKPPTKLFLNESETTIDFLKGILVSDVALVKYWPPGSAQFSGAGIADVLAIYTKKPNGNVSSGLAPMSKFSYDGYMPVQDFTKDFLEKKEALASKRATVYWNPNLAPADDKPVYTIRFNNSTDAKKLRIVLEGYTIDGKLLYFEKEIE